MCAFRIVRSRFDSEMRNEFALLQIWLQQIKADEKKKK